ncbi:MAG: hypothetical protein AB7F41_04585 [Methylocystis sp.]|uniref:hypothetical protein n=1 Tax=Methylocystis sp. TaxID=1911079 RepID=UPI003D0D09BB
MERRTRSHEPSSTNDGEPFTTAQANETVFWPMTPGAHRNQARLALAPVASRAVRIVIE